MISDKIDCSFLPTLVFTETQARAVVSETKFKLFREVDTEMHISHSFEIIT